MRWNYLINELCILFTHRNQRSIRLSKNVSCEFDSRQGRSILNRTLWCQVSVVLRYRYRKRATTLTKKSAVRQNSLKYVLVQCCQCLVTVLRFTFDTLISVMNNTDLLYFRQFNRNMTYVKWDRYHNFLMNNGSKDILAHNLQINARETRRGNQEWTIQRNWQHWGHQTQNENKQSKNTTQYLLDTTICKQRQITYM